jgi:hypothetical protein
MLQIVTTVEGKHHGIRIKSAECECGSMRRGHCFQCGAGEVLVIIIKITKIVIVIIS